MFCSIVMPTHNRLHLLRDAIETVRRQDFTDWELVVFDNASEDPVGDHVRSLGDSRIRHVRSDEFLPVTSSWNRAIDLARGDYVILLGDDDGLTPHYFRRVQEIVEKFHRPDVIYNNIYQFWHPGVARWEPSGYLIDVRHGFFFADREAPFRLTGKEARRAVLGSVRLKINFSFNSQAFIYNRKFLAQLCTDGPVYRSPFPDYYIANVALMRSRSTVVVPEPLAVAGVSKASFGFTIYNGQDERGAALLNTNLPDDPVYREIQSRLLPGPAYNTNFVVAMEYVARALPRLGKAVDFQRYRRAQIFALLERGIRGETSEVEWPEMRNHLSQSERLWASCVWRILRANGRFPRIGRHLLPQVWKSVSMTGSDPMVRHCGKHGFSRVTDLYDAFSSGALS
jgi:glycosyltransferase involved in cell wall biosynthesis